MPQLFQVLKCYKCSVFQVHQTKKSNKWECKLCGEKQSIKRHYGLGTGKECRLHVQKLNGLRGEMNESTQLNKSSDEDDMSNENSTQSDSNVSDKGPRQSKWSNFIEKSDPVYDLQSNESMYLGNTEVVLEVPTKKRRKFNSPKVKQKPLPPTSFQNELLLDGTLKCWQNKPFGNPNISLTKNNTFVKVDPPSRDNKSTIFKSILPEKQSLSSLNKENDNHHALGDIIDEPSNLDENPAKVCIPPKVNKNSKWAQFTDELEQEDQVLSPLEENVSAGLKVSRENSPEYINVPSKLFALCDEDELDDVLAL